MEKIISTNQVWWIYAIFLLYIVLLVFVIIREIKNTNSKKSSFAWIICSLIMPIVPFFYVLVLLIKNSIHYLKQKE